MRRPVLLLAAAMLTGCSGSTGGDDARLVESYLSAVERRDIDAINALRCDGARIDDSRAEQFGRELDRIADALGVPFEVASLTEVDEPEVAPAAGEAHRQLVVRLQTSDGPSEPLQWVTVMEGGHERLCAASPVVSFALRERFADIGVEIDPRPVPELEELMPILGAPFRVIDDDLSLSEVTNSDPVEVAARTWTEPPYGGIRVSVYRYPDSDAAASAAADYFVRVSPDAVSTFEVPGVPLARCLRYSASAWTMVQPPGVADEFDSCWLVADDVWITVIANGKLAAADGTVAADLIQQVDAALDEQ